MDFKKAIFCRLDIKIKRRYNQKHQIVKKIINPGGKRDEIKKARI